MSQILLIGYGAIGQYVYKAIQQCSHSKVVAVLCRAGRETQARIALHKDIVCINDISKIPMSIDLAVECAGHSALIDHAPAILQRGINIICVSNGAMSDASVAAQLEQSAIDGKSRLKLLPGAIGGIDMLCAAKAGGLDSVCYRGVKPPAGWKGSHAENLIDLDSLDTPRTHFKGNAREAARLFPKNANVAATVALAGIGLDKTLVELVADPTIIINRHEVEATGMFGRFAVTIEGNPLPDNPRSSALTAMSVVKAIDDHNTEIVVG